MHWILWEVRLLVLLCRCRKPWTVLSVQVSPYMGPLSRIHSCALVRFPHWIPWSLYSVMSRTTNQIPCLGAAGESSLKLFVVLVQAHPHSSFLTKQGHWLGFANCKLYLLLGLSTAGLHSFQAFLPALMVRWIQKIASTASRAICQLPCLGGWGRGCSKLLSSSPTGSQVGRSQELPSPLAVFQSPCLCIAWEHCTCLCSEGDQLYSATS